jgi:hypothetical protein
MKNGNKYIGGLVVLENNQWYFCEKMPYEYTQGKINDNWKLLQIYF